MNKDISFYIHKIRKVLNEKMNKRMVNVLQNVLISTITSICVFSIAMFFVWQNKDFFLNQINPKTEIVQNVHEEILEDIGEEPIVKEEIKKDEVKSIIDVVKESNPKVVSIVVNKEVPKYSNKLNLSTGKFEKIEDGVEDKKVGEGSGFFVNSNGTIITNRHVVQGEGLKYTVYTNDGVKRVATILAIDPIYDIALLKIDGSKYPYFELADSDKISVGESVIAIGNALGEFKNSVSVGVVSGLSRSVLASTNSGSQERLEKVIQTDAAINPGNSGGPLINLYGKVVGVNVAVARASENIGFALPVNSIKDIITSVAKTGKISRPFLGIRYVEITQEIFEDRKLAVDYGVLIVKGKDDTEKAVIENSPAEKAGIKEGDIILSLNGRKIDSNNSFALMIRDKKVGDTIILSVLSEGVTKTLYVLLDKALD